MQAFNMNADLLLEELQLFGLEKAEIKRHQQKTASRIIKLCSVPQGALISLQEAASSFNCLMVASPEKANSKGVNSAIIAGSESALYKIANLLIEEGGSPAKVGSAMKRLLNNLNRPRVKELQLGSGYLPLGKRTLIMGILNITPDSFSDGGRFDQLESALAQAYRMAEEGADIIDIGGESTRPGHKSISAEEELKRVLPVISALKKDRSFKTPLSIDTSKAPVAEEALKSGAEMLNDVWGLKEDNAIGSVAARFKVPVCLMHNRTSTDYDNLITDILFELERSIHLAQEAGIEENKIIIDPGIGFGKTSQQNLEVMRHLQVFQSLGYPLLLGTSRKSMIGKILDLPVEQRLEGTAATVAFGISAGADIVRVHDVMEMRRVAMMTDAIIRR